MASAAAGSLGPLLMRRFLKAKSNHAAPAHFQLPPPQKPRSHYSIFEILKRNGACRQASSRPILLIVVRLIRHRPRNMTKRYHPAWPPRRYNRSVHSGRARLPRRAQIPSSIVKRRDQFASNPVGAPKLRKLRFIACIHSLYLSPARESINSEENIVRRLANFAQMVTKKMK